MSKKQLNTQNIQNELTGASVFFRRPAERPAPSSQGSAHSGLPASEAVFQAALDEKQPERDQDGRRPARDEKNDALKNRANVRSPEPYARTDGTDVRPPEWVGQVPLAPDKRRPERYAFQFWADQITRLKKLRQVLNIAKDPEDREEISLSDMVRQAVDDYLAEQTKRISQRERTDDPGVRPYGQKP